MTPRSLAVAILVVIVVGVAVFLIVRRDGDGGVEDVSVATNVEFELIDAECGYRNVVTAEQSIPPQEGEFCLVRVTITNRDQQPARLDPACQLLVSTEGERFAPRPDVLAVDQASNQAFQAPIGPGQAVDDAALYYDVPRGTKPGSAEFHTVCGGAPIRVEL